MIAVGVDPGVDGAVGIVASGGGVMVMDLPTKATLGGGLVKRRVAFLALVKLLREHVPPGAVAVVEDVHTFPGTRNAPQFQGSLMQSVAIVECALEACGIPYTMLGVQAWKRFYGLGPDKNAARAKAIQILPDAAPWLHLVKHHNRAEALLMAHYHMRHST